VRKAAKEYSTGKRIEGVFEEGERICLVEDVVTTGGALIAAVEALRESGLVCESAVCVVDREEGGEEELARQGIRLRHLFTAQEILAAG
jgi:orotate phosphoribosyltransferase